MIRLVAFCDEPDCDGHQDVYFDKLDETFQDYIDYLKYLGWNVNGGTDQKSIKLTCPKEHV